MKLSPPPAGFVLPGAERTGRSRLDASATARRRLPPAAVAALVAAATALGVLVVLAIVARGDQEARPAPRPTPAEEPSPSRIVQAQWRIEVRAAGATRAMSKRDRRRLRAQRPRTAKLVRSLYEALYLRPGARSAAIDAAFSPVAGRSFRRLDAIGMPERATRVKTLVRSARVSIEAPRARRAVAAVRVRARGRVGARTVRLFHRATLWLERSGARWRVVAYDVEQAPVPS
jgi:hypothetical protein